MSARHVRSWVLAAGACLALAAAVVPWPTAHADEPPFFAIEHARIVPVSGPAIDDGTVVIANGLIRALGTNVSIPPTAEVIDGHGLTVYPGLVDAMTSVGLGAPQPAAPAGRGAAGRRGPPPAGAAISMGPEDRPGTSPWRVAGDVLKTDDPRIESWRNAGFTTVLASPAGGMIPGQASVVDLAGERSSDMVVKSYAAVAISLRPSGGFWNFPGSLMGAIAYVKQVYIDTRWYQQASAAYDADPRGLERPRSDRTEHVMAGTLERHEPVLLPGNLDKEILRAIDLARELEVPAVLYGVQQGYLVAGQVAASRLPALVNLDWPTRPKDADPEAEETLAVLRLREHAPGTPAAFARAGVPFAFYSGNLKDPKEILKNAKKAIDAGLAPDAALRAFTLSAAQILGVSNQLGSIEPGKIANLVVTDGDLFAEKTTVKIVFVDGKRFTIHPKPPAEPKPAQTPAN
jgi:imidazolonepropionase-like amidohydrolase